MRTALIRSSDGLRRIVFIANEGNHSLACAMFALEMKITLATRSLTTKTVAIVLLVMGLSVYASGLSNPFMGDDNDQIVNNPAVHSLSHISSFFSGGTFTGAGSNQLSGTYYRPLMTTSYALIYALFGLHPLAFHLFQLGLFILGAFLVFLVLRYFLTPMWALAVAAVFLVHPLNSQAAFSIPNLQEPLYFVFGMTALWLVLHFHSNWSLLGSGICLLLSLLSKETGIVFAGISLTYFALFDRKRLPPLAGATFCAVVLYLALKIHAVGLAGNAHIAPIDNLSLAGRLANAPAIILHYLGLFIFPMPLASSYFWVYPVNSFAHFWLPLLCLLGLAWLAVAVSKNLRQKVPSRQFLTYVFFITWFALGLLPHLQIVPLDLTASDTWFYVSIVGLLGALGLLAQAYVKQDKMVWILVGELAIAVFFGTRTAWRGFDWNGNATIALADLKVSPNNFVAEYQLANYFEAKSNHAEAELLARKSVDTFPTGTNWDALGKIYMDEGRYPEAKLAFKAGLRHQSLPSLYQDSAALTIAYGEPADNLSYLEKLTTVFPNNATIWTALAVAQYRTGNSNAAKISIARARSLNPSNASIAKIYDRIISNRPHILN